MEDVGDHSFDRYQLEKPDLFDHSAYDHLYYKHVSSQPMYGLVEPMAVPVDKLAQEDIIYGSGAMHMRLPERVSQNGAPEFEKWQSSGSLHSYDDKRDPEDFYDDVEYYEKYGGHHQASN